MFKVNDKVIHSREGLSTIVSTTTMADREYFVIHANRGGGENIYVLTNNTTNIIRPIMNEDAAREVIKYMKTVVAEFISNTKQRRDQYKRRLLSGNVLDLAFLSRQLYFYNYYNANGQPIKLGPTDVQMLKDAETILYDEFALSFNKPREEIFEFIAALL